ncbi:MAG: YncE family protein [Cyclobacteriaceae bacterium]
MQNTPARSRQIVTLTLSLVITLVLNVRPTQAQLSGHIVVVNKAESNLSLISLKELTEVTTIETGTDPHEVAVSPDGQTAVVTNYGSQQPGKSLSVISLKDKKRLKDIDLIEYYRPHGIEFINNNEVLVTSETQKALLKVDLRTDKVTLVGKTDQTAGHMVTYSPKDQKAYVANIVSGTVSCFDVSSNAFLRNISFTKGIEGLDVSRDGKELWVANRDNNDVTVWDLTKDEKVAVLPAGQVAFRVKVLPNQNYAVVSNGQAGTLSVYDARTKSLVKEIHFSGLDKGLDQLTDQQDEEHPPVPVGVAADGKGNYVFVALAGYDKVAVVDAKNWKIIATIDCGQAPDGIYYSTMK